MKDECSATAIKYGLIAAGIAVAVITVVGTIGSRLDTTFATVGNGLKE
jgi:pilus assembly protein Flp/PilA